MKYQWNRLTAEQEHILVHHLVARYRNLKRLSPHSDVLKQCINESIHSIDNILTIIGVEER